MTSHHQEALSSKYQVAYDEVEKITDGLGKGVDNDVKHIVTALRLWNFPTSGSCGGHLNRAESYPWIEIYAPEQEELAFKAANQYQKDKIVKLLADFYSKRKSSVPLKLQSQGIYGGFRLQSVLWDDEKDIRLTKFKLEQLRHEMNDFADFLVREFKPNI